ncbi:hypothetical protein NQ314_017452, partial [Rhamnusium bicolor]
TILPGIGLLVLGFYTSDNKTEYMCTLYITMSSIIATNHGYTLNTIDISPTFCGTLRGITSAVGNVFALLTPLAVQVVVKNEQDPREWRTIFIIISCINFLAAIFYIVFASGKLQRWTTYSLIDVVNYGTIRRSSKNHLNENHL